MTEVPTAPPLDPDQPGFLAPGEQAAPGTGDAAPVQQDYFGFEADDKWYLPDGISWMRVQVMNEGAKSKFQKKTQRDVILERGSGNARFNVDPSVERHAIILESVTEWNLLRGGNTIGLSVHGNDKKNLRDWLELANPKLVEDLETFIRKLNPWLAGEMTVEDIDKEIDRLQDMKADLLERQAGEGSSSNK